MIIEILVVIALGIFAGTITGLIPGLHVNLVALMLFAFSGFFLGYVSPLALVIFIVAMSITHTFVDFIPSIFLGAPDDDTALSVLPGHKFLLKGEGYGAVKITLVGSFFALFIVILTAPLFVIILPKVYPIIRQFMSVILISASVFLILREKKSKFWALFLFVLSGILGIASLNLAVIKQPLFPLLSGLFGVSLLSMSFIRKVKIPKQKQTSLKVNNKDSFKALLASAISGPLCCFLPGLGAAQAAVIGSDLFKKMNQKTFLILLGAINTIVMGLSFVALYAIGRTRTGSAVIVDKLIELNFNYLVIILGVVFVSGCIAYFLTIILARFFANNLTKVKYNYICLAVIILISSGTLLISGLLGLLILLTGTAIGILSSIKGIRKMYLMGCLMLPIILYYL